MARTCILSPHPDDAVWSLGGWLADRNAHEEVVVVSVFDGDEGASAGSGDREDVNQAWRRFVSPSLRRNEDKRALELIGGRVESLGFIDAAMRRDANTAYIFDRLEALFDMREIGKEDLLLRVARSVSACLEPGDAVFAPLALGGHVDHRIVKDAARMLPQGITGWYADFPYARNIAESDMDKALQSIGGTVRPAQVDVDFDVWRRAALSYRSQVVRLFGGAGAFEEQLSDYAYGDMGVASLRIWWTA